MCVCCRRITTRLRQQAQIVKWCLTHYETILYLFHLEIIGNNVFSLVKFLLSHTIAAL